jgi:hypothetical protein
MMAEAGADLFNRTCFKYPTLGDPYKYATYAAILKRDGLVVDDSQPGQISYKAKLLRKTSPHRITSGRKSLCRNLTTIFASRSGMFSSSTSSVTRSS